MISKATHFFLFAIIACCTQAQVANGVSLLPADSDIFQLKTESGKSTSVELITVSGQPFKEAFRISTINDGYNVKYKLKDAVKKGDVFLLSFYSRTISSKRETGLAFFEIGFSRFINGKYEWPPLLERGMSFGTEWVLTQIPFKAAMDIEPGEVAFVLRCGNMPQVFDISRVQLLGYKQTVSLQDLPRSIIHYDGDAPDASWRKAAADRIEKIRKGNLNVKVLDKNGKPVSGATVSVRMKKSAFSWGTATSSQLVLDTVNPNAKIYRDTLLKYFNKVVLENELKAKNWSRFNLQQTQAGINWFRKYNIPIRGHVMVWPSWQHSPHLVKYKNDTAALRTVILTQIAEQTAAINGQFTEWDVVNEPYAHHEIIDALGGKEVMLEWFAAAQKHAPNVKLFLNEYTMFHGKDAGSESFFNTIKYLIDNNAPVAAIGEQAHIGGTPPSIDYVLERLDRFSVFNLPIQISEFDITSDDDDFKARYMHDFMTAIFSHPSVNGFMQWGFWESAHWMPAGALWDKNWNVRPHGKVFTELVTKTWCTNTNGTTDKKGFFTTRAFNGEYEVEVTYRNKKVLQQTVLDANGQTVLIKLVN